MFSLNKNKDHFINILKLLLRTEANMNLPRVSLCFVGLLLGFFFGGEDFVCLFGGVGVGVFLFGLVLVCHWGFCNYFGPFFFSLHGLYIHLRKSLKTSYACKTSVPEQRVVYITAMFTKAKYCDTSLRHTAGAVVSWHLPASYIRTRLWSWCCKNPLSLLPLHLGAPLTVSSVTELQRQPARIGQRQV